MIEEVTFIEKGRSVTNTDIMQLEQDLDIKLPSDYVSFVLKNNGGIPSKIYFSTSENDYVVNQFFPIDEGDVNFKNCFRQFKVDQEILPQNLIPIADDAFGNLICMDLNNGSISLWDHEDSRITKLSSSLSKFLTNLKLAIE